MIQIKGILSRELVHVKILKGITLALFQLFPGSNSALLVWVRVNKGRSRSWGAAFTDELWHLVSSRDSKQPGFIICKDLPVSVVAVFFCCCCCFCLKVWLHTILFHKTEDLSRFSRIYLWSDVWKRKFKL